jgi:putative oxidoreductase
MRRTLGWIARTFLAGLFLYAGFAKLVDVRGFAVDIANYRMVPSMFVAPLAAALPGIEIACGFALLAGRTARAAAALATGLLVTFTVAAAQALARDINIDCGCFGSVRAPVTMATIARDVLLVAIGLGAFILAPTGNEKAPRRESPGG